MQKLHRDFVGLLGYLPAADRRRVEHALERAIEWHKGQERESGAPYATHPISVAIYLAGIEAERDTLIAALLHDVVEDNRADDTVIRKEFGDEVAKLVDGVTKLTKIKYEGDRSARQVASLRKMLIVASNDLRVILIKLADRWHNVETLSSLHPEKQERIAFETLDIYVPFARIVGLWELKRRFEEVCFPLAFPKESREWHEHIITTRKRLRKEREKFVEDINEETSREVEPRLVTMTDYELYQKFYGDIGGLEQTEHIDSVLLIVRGTAKAVRCYQVMGEIHQRYPVRPLSFRDYINAPLPNGYQALHTTIFLSRNHELRLRIQTADMHDYVAKRKVSSWISQKNNDIYTALASLRKPAYNQEQFMNDLKQTVLDRINVFTTAGEIIRLPNGATGIDFAFALNPGSVALLAGIRINGEMHEATHEIRDGDTAELVLLERGEKERRTLLWLEKVKSVDARESLKNALSTQPLHQQRAEGISLLELEARKHLLPVWPLQHLASTREQLSYAMGTASYDELLEQLGKGELSITKTIDAYEHIFQSPDLFQRVMQFFHLLPRSRVLDKGASIIDINVYGEDRPGLIYDITRCIADRKINIAKFAVYAVPPRDALYRIRLEVQEFKEFSLLYDAILQVPSIKRIVRKR